MSVPQPSTRVRTIEVPAIPACQGFIAKGSTVHAAYLLATALHITEKEMALCAGVSQSGVHRALTGTLSPSVNVRRGVRAAFRNRGYRYSESELFDA